jgi:hypothetical protein
MKKLLLVIVVLVALVWFAGARFLNTTALTAGSARWPNNLGTANDIAHHFPRLPMNEAATRVAELSKPLGVQFDERPAGITSLRAPLNAYLARAVAGVNDDIDAPPPAVAAWLAQHGNELRAVQQQLVAQDPPQWPVDAEALLDAPIPRLLAHMDLFRLLAVDALEQRRAGNDAVAWDDLHASWKLSQGLLTRPELISQLIAIAGTRLANGVAAKLSAPTPAWRHELSSFDFGAAAVAALAYEGTHGWRVARAYPAGEPADVAKQTRIERLAATVAGPWTRYRAGQSLDAQRELATELASLRACDPHPRTPRDTPNLTEAWRRIGRVRAEVEGVEKLLALKAARAQSGAWPESMPSIEGSSCTDGRWRYSRAADGSMSLAFTKPIGVAPSQLTIVPLAFRYGP